MSGSRVVIVTGAGGGIGSAVAARFLQNGDTVIGADLAEEALTGVAGRLDGGDRFVPQPTDVTDESSVHALAALAADRFGRIDVLVHCAGWFPIRPFDEMTLDEWRMVIDINLTGSFLLTHAIVPTMREQKSGRIVLFGSASVFGGVPGQTHYVAAKAGVVGFARSLAREVGRDGITVNVVTPGLTLTSAVTSSFPESMTGSQRALRALPRDEVAADLVGPTFFLASDDAAFISGQIVNVDGGLHMH